jgi:BMFP domain-containing protein YqiC
VEFANTLVRRDKKLMYHKGRLVLFDSVEEMDEKMDEAKKKIDAEVEQEIRDVIQKVLIEKYLI